MIPNEPKQLGLPLEQYRLSLPGTVPPAYPRALGRPYEIDPVEDRVPLAHHLWTIRRHIWKIAAVVVACVITAIVISSRTTPVYEATATIDVDRQLDTRVLGSDSAPPVNSDTDQFLATQVRLIQSDSVLRPVVAALKLNEREGGGIIRSPAMERAPAKLPNLKVTRPANTYLLLVSYRSTDPTLAADVANAVAKSYLEHTYAVRYRSAAGLSSFMEKQLRELKVKMEASSDALLRFERELSVINPEEKTNVGSARLLQLNTEYTNAQIDRVRKQAAVEQVRQGAPEASQVSTQGESLRKQIDRLNEAEMRFTEVKARFGENHPEYKKAQAQVDAILKLTQNTSNVITKRIDAEYNEAVRREKMIQLALGDQKNELDRLNARAVEYQALKREADADRKVYDELVHRIKESGINAGFQSSSIRIADSARPNPEPVSPNTKLNAILALLVSSLFAVGFAIARDAVDDTVQGPEHISGPLKAEVIGTLPRVNSWKGLAPGDPQRAEIVETKKDSPDPSTERYGEAIRTLRTSILLSRLEDRVGSLLITSASPGDGKSTVVAHLAIANARQGRRTLLIDADLRRPSIHRHFKLPMSAGLSDVLCYRARWQDLRITSESIPNLAILTAGPIVREAPEYLGAHFMQILAEAADDYDLVIVDAPPLLGFAEPLQMAAAVDSVLVVARAGSTSRRSVGAVLHTLSRLRTSVVGVVLNEVQKETAGYSYHQYYRRNDYNA